MRHCLSVPEIMRIICDEIHNEKCPHPRELLNLALVSRDWTVIALDCLWREISGMDRLIRCMPEDLWSFANLDLDDLLEFSNSKKRVILRRSLTNSDLDIFKKYAPRVLTFTHDDRIVVAPHIYQTLSQSCSPPLLPNLQVLNWDVAYSIFTGTKRNSFPLVRLFLGPQLETLRFDAEISHPAHFHIFQMIPAKISPNISCLSLTFSERGGSISPEAVEDFSATLHEWHHLSSLVIEDITLNGLFSLATMPKLKELKIRSARYLWDLPRSGVEGQAGLFSRLQSLSDPFPALELIAIDALFDDSRPVLNVTNFFTILHNAKISEIWLSLYHLNDTRELQNLFWAIADHCDHASLKKFKLQLNSVSHLPSSTIQPLLRFSALQSVHVDAYQVHYGMTISEDDMSLLLSSWPDIRKLWIMPNAKQPSDTTLLAFLPLTNSTKLRHLGLSLNASDAATRKVLRENFPECYKGLQNHSLRTLEVGRSPISHKEFVAKFLSEVFANLDDIASNRYNRATTDFKRWHYVSRVLLPLLSDVRRREREILGIQEVRAAALKGTSRRFFERAEEGDVDLSEPGSFGYRQCEIEWEDDLDDI